MDSFFFSLFFSFFSFFFLVRLFTPPEIEELIVGKAEFDMGLWKERAKYGGVWSNSSSTISKRFWRVLESFTEEQKSQVVLFAWGA